MNKSVPSNFYEFASKFDDLYHVHIPKTGGNFVQVLLSWADIPTNKNPLRLGAPQGSADGMAHNVCHPDVSFYNPYCGNFKKFQESLRFSIVRNPYSMLTSLYVFEKRTGGHNKNFKFSIGDMSFKDFVRASIDTECWMYESWRKFLYMPFFNEDADAAVHVLLRNEYLSDALRHVLLAADLTLPSNEIPVIERDDPRSNSSKIDYKTFYDDETIEMVRERWSRELNAFGYDFEGPVDDFCILNPSNIKYDVMTDKMWWDGDSTLKGAF